MPTVVLKADNLDELNRNYAQARLKRSVFLNSVPKSGTHLLRNIVRMFVPVDQQYHKTYVQHAVLKDHMAAFNPAKPMLSWGHLFFSDAASIVLHETRKVLLVRDPYDWVLARARFFLSDSFQGSIEHLKGGRVTASEVLNMMIFGVHEKMPTLQEIYLHNAVSWLGTDVMLLRYEELLAALGQLDSTAGESYFGSLLAACGIDPLPADWRERIRVGSDRRQSGTARENLRGLAAAIPDELPQAQRQLVDFAAPGLRRLLGYA
jgi:hypothetical protein